MGDFDFNNLEDIKAEEKRLHDEYKAKLAELKKVQKEKEAVGQVFTKGLLPIYVLHILKSGPTNGNEISTKVSERTNGLWTPSTGGIYPLLKKLEKEGLVVGKWDDPKKKFQKLSIAALIISIFPLMTFIPVLFHITLTDGVRSVWAGINIVSVFTGLILSITCIKNSDSRSAINIISTIISSFWVLLMGGIIALALFISIVQ